MRNGYSKMEQGLRRKYISLIKQLRISGKDNKLARMNLDALIKFYYEKLEEVEEETFRLSIWGYNRVWTQ